MHYVTALLVTYRWRSGFMFTFYWGGLAFCILEFLVTW